MMRSKAIIAAVILAAGSVPMGAGAQGIGRGAAEGANTGGHVAGPVGSVVGGVVGGAVGGAVGGVKGVLGIPQQTDVPRHRYHRYRGTRRHRD